MGVQLGRAREFMKRNIVLIIMLPAIVGLHYGWQKIQDIELFVPKQQRKDLPVIQGAKYVEQEIKNKMSGVRLEEERVKGVFCHSVRDPAYISMLSRYRRLLFSVYGPKGSSILICNAAGQETLAASSSEIIKQLPFAHPTIKYINALISAQNAACGLNGLYTGALCVRLLEEALKCEDDIPYPMVSEVSEWIISELLDILSKSPDEVIMELDIGDMKQISSFVKTIIGAKNCLNLNKQAVDDLSLNVVKAFLKSIPNEYSSDGFGHVTIATQDGSSTTHTRVFDGVLYREPDISPERIERLRGQDMFNIVLFTVPLLYLDGQEESVHWRGSGTKEENFINKVLPCLLSYMKTRNIHILANQKPVHPVIKFELEREGFLVLERMGTNLAEGLMKETTESCLAALRMMVVDGKVVAGGGCLEAWLAGQVSHLINSNMQHLTEITDAAPHHVVKVASIFLRVFIELALQLGGGSSSTRFDWSLDSVFHHLWHTQPKIVKEDGGRCSTHSPLNSQNCVCGLVKEEVLKYKHNGLWHPVEFQLQYNITGPRSKSSKYGRNKAGKSPRSADGHSSKSNFEGTWSNDSSVSDFGFHNLDLEADSLEEAGETTEEEVDSLEKVVNSQEEELDSLEGKLDSFDIEEDMDSLEDILNGTAEPNQVQDDMVPKAKLEAQAQEALYDSFPAKYNAIRLALEGFTQLFHIGQCVFDK
ncbi:McKusick-Kaufman/Bardet-Biedl syndromes putative chaperonin-like [Homarus americanus]|uniref:McKusick-Kaufman/Bardet-Biedl syndromes putative chaperonin-like n=1 Tax=Homarus americanus TaxID=6706 RepID=A0A8J5N182_HOMAM|nr:McKusick-Kaufman/Bardet-Biedl syndromes putative chaperonin-like [Homarus americanus]